MTLIHAAYATILVVALVAAYIWSQRRLPPDQLDEPMSDWSNHDDKWGGR